MLLGAARHLAETRGFRGTVHFIFQPAEENEGGARKMIEEGLFETFPVRSVYGMHNWPGQPVGSMAMRPGPMMAAFERATAILSERRAVLEEASKQLLARETLNEEEILALVRPAGGAAPASANPSPAPAESAIA